MSDEVVARALATLLENERAKPWAFGMTSLGLSRALGTDEAALVQALAGAVERGSLALRAGYYATSSFVPELSAPQRAFFDQAFAPDPKEPYRPIERRALFAAMRAARIGGLELALDMLVASGAVVQVAADFYRGAQLEAIRSRLEAELRPRTGLTVAQFRTAIGTTRKYAVPLLEWFDAAGLTERRGDERFLR